MSWAFDEREMHGVQEINWGLAVSLVELPGGPAAIKALSDTEEAVLIDLDSLMAWFRHHRPDLLRLDD